MFKSRAFCVHLRVAVLALFAYFSAFNVHAEYLSSSGLMSVSVQGQGQDIVLLPGLSSSSKVWSDLSDQLKDRYRLHAVDLAGFAGRPSVDTGKGSTLRKIAAEVTEYISANELSNPILIGHSMGGLISLIIASEQGSNVGGVIVVDALPFYSLIFDPASTENSARPIAERIRNDISRQTKGEFQAFSEASLTRLVKSNEGKRIVMSDAVESDPILIGELVYELMTTDLRPALKDIKYPVSILVAHDDSMGVSSRQVEMMYENSYTSLQLRKILTISGALHFIMLDQPASFFSAIDCSLGWIDAGNSTSKCLVKEH
ncbi:alpha/beta fold hydrolase [Pseudomonas kuykendallii]|uniref:Alpha/beta hydrolase n=1 Tax=Pseudomonas kuykendallii TaxID=1007099 RepID=A0A2W5DBJ8_9PSED|nr:alpha/beta hydrolase [Pseudomonas kuykendallii]PZP26457.1 MAG: alpha/beta hydrolase [Pseudomonas kuykendallii]